MKNDSKETQTQHTLSVYFCGQEDCGPNHSFGPAMRPHYLLHVIFHGKGIYQCSGHTYHLKAGDAFLIRPMDSIYYRADTSDPWSYAWAGFDGSACKEILKQTVFSFGWASCFWVIQQKRNFGSQNGMECCMR